MSPDGDPIVGEAPGCRGSTFAAAFVGHGFMMAPVVSRYYARHLLVKETHALFDVWSAKRFTGAGGTRGGGREQMHIGLAPASDIQARFSPPMSDSMRDLLALQG
jgi:hypothetical protein